MYQFKHPKQPGEYLYFRQDKAAKYKQGGHGDQPPHFNVGTKPKKLGQHHYFGVLE